MHQDRKFEQRTEVRVTVAGSESFDGSILDASWNPGDEDENAPGYGWWQYQVLRDDSIDTEWVNESELRARPDGSDLWAKYRKIGAAIEDRTREALAAEFQMLGRYRDEVLALEDLLRSTCGNKWEPEELGSILEEITNPFLGPALEKALHKRLWPQGSEE